MTKLLQQMHCATLGDYVVTKLAVPALAPHLNFPNQHIEATMPLPNESTADFLPLASVQDMLRKASTDLVGTLATPRRYGTYVPLTAVRALTVCAIRLDGKQQDLLDREELAEQAAVEALQDRDLIKSVDDLCMRHRKGQAFAEEVQSVLRNSPAPDRAREAIRIRVRATSKVIDDNGILIEPTGGSTDVSFDSMRGYILKFSVSVVFKAESKAIVVLEGVEGACLLFDPADIGTRQIELYASQWEHLKTLSKCFFTPPVEARVQLSMKLTGRGTSFSGRLIGFENQEALRANIKSATESAVRELF